MNQDTICALATADGVGAIGIIRISGQDALAVVNRIFEGKNLEKVPTHTVHYGFIKDKEEIIDEVMVSVFHAPRTFTAENSAEISFHGSPHIAKKILEALLKNGARTAKAGEFTMRAFMNGRIDLSQAESIADLIASENEASRKAALEQLKGGISKEIAVLRGDLLNFTSLIELELDFAEEDVEFADRSALMGLIANLKTKLGSLIDSFQYGNAVKNGINVAIIGKPNAGKSTLLNALLKEERAIVSDIAGTTRDAIDTRYNRFGFEFNLVDTAGIRRKSKVKEDLEFYSVMRSIRAIEHSDVCILMLDATRGFESQDANIFWLAQRNRKGIVILVNKWDLVEKENNTAKAYEAAIRKEIEPFTDVPIIFVSALNKQRIYKAIETAVEVYNNRTKRIPTRQLNEVMLPIIENYPPPAIKGKYVKIKFCTQLPTPMPQFAFFANLPQYVKDPYRRFIENKLRENFDFKGVPIDVYFRQK